MSKSRILFLLVSAALVLPILFFSGQLLGASANDEEGNEDSVYKYLSVFSEVLQLVRNVYVEEPDVELLIAGAMDGASDALDPFSLYVPPQQMTSFLATQKVGASLSGVQIVREKGVAYVIAVQDGSPAAAAGVKRGDIVAELQGRSSRTMPLWELQGILAGAPGTKVELELVRRGAPVKAAFVLAAFKPPPPQIDDNRGVGVLRIASFSPKTSAEVERALRRFTGDKLVLDLRGVAGGDPELAYKVAELFVAGKLGALLGTEGPVKTFESRPGEIWPGEVAVLIDRGSQGPAEVLAAVIDQARDATLVGEKSFGYAGHRNLLKLSSGAALQITDGFYTGPNQTPFNDGLTPDVVVHQQLVTDDDEVPEVDEALERALDLLLGEGVEPELDKAA